MRNIFTSLMIGGALCFGFAGCGEKSSVTTETQVETPQGTTTTTEEKTIETTGDAPPPAQP